MVGQISNYLPISLPHLRTVTIACGVAAAISTAFNAPLAALIFTHEVILRHYSLRMFTAVTIASASGYFVANVVFDRAPLFLIEIDGSFRAIEFLLFAVEGVACGVLAVLLMTSLKFGAALAQRLPVYAPFKPMIAGFATALVALQVPEVLGAGQEVFHEAILGNSYSADALLWILLAKLLVTVTCVGFGFAGGVIFPSMLMGVLFGAMFALVVPDTLLDSYSGISDYAICGMVAVMSPVIGAPMTALLLVFEMTRNYEVTIAAMVAVVFANLVASIWFGRSLYDQQLAQRGIDLSFGRERAYLMHQKVGDHATDCLPVVQEDASLGEAMAQMAAAQTPASVVVDDEQRYIGILQQQPRAAQEEAQALSSIDLTPAPVFDQNTSLWEAMQVMRDYMGEAIAVVDCDNGRYLGAIPEAAVINAYLDATETLRREEHEV
jgi:CIC family chloride channel protein